MGRFIGRRLLGVIPVLFGLSIVLFVFMHALPGDPAAAILGQYATPDKVAQLRAVLGLDRPLYEQYFLYLSQLLRGDLGHSVVNNRAVLDEFLIRFPNTVELTVAALALAVGIGVPLGRYAARHAGSGRDGGVTVLSVAGVSVPVFVLGLVLQVVFAVELGWLPASGQQDARLVIPAVTHLSLVDPLLVGRLDAFIDALKHLVLPAITLASIPLSSITRMTRAAVLDVMNEDYVRTARAKGLREARVESRHIMRNAWLPVITVIGWQVGTLLGGAVITETVFAWNGVGRWAVQAIQDHDYTVVESTVLLFSFIFILVNLIVDVGYAFLNPRIRYS